MRSVRELPPTVVGIISIVLIALGLGGAFSVNKFQSLRGVYEVSADLEDAAGLQSGNEVRVAGVKVGRITDVTLTADAARVTMEIESDVQLPQETKVEVKLKTLLGQKFIDLQYPKGYVAAASNGGNPRAATSGYLDAGDVIPKTQTSVPFEIYQASNEGTAVLEGIDKEAFRHMITVLGRTVSGSKEELGEALVALDEAADVLEPKSKDISALLRHTRDVTKTLGDEGEDIEGILDHGANVLETLADRRATLSSLLDATNDLTLKLGLLLRQVRGNVNTGVGDLNTLLTSVEAETESLDAALAELGTSQEMFGRPLTFGRFIEGHVCAVTTADTCVPYGSPENPDIPSRGAQPPPSFRAGGQR